MGIQFVFVIITVKASELACGKKQRGNAPVGVPLLCRVVSLALRRPLAVWRVERPCMGHLRLHCRYSEPFLCSPLLTYFVHCIYEVKELFKYSLITLRTVWLLGKRLLCHPLRVLFPTRPRRDSQVTCWSCRRSGNEQLWGLDHGKSSLLTLQRILKTPKAGFLYTSSLSEVWFHHARSTIVKVFIVWINTE